MAFIEDAAIQVLEIRCVRTLQATSCSTSTSPVSNEKPNIVRIIRINVVGMSGFERLYQHWVVVA